MTTPAFDYAVRESARARNVRLRVSAREGLVVVVPRGFPPRRIPALLESRRAWIERALDRVAVHRASLAEQRADGPPARLELRALGEEWRVEYRPTTATSVSAREHEGRVLVVSGAVSDADATRGAIRRWLARRAKATLVPRLFAMADEHRVPLRRVTMRWQRFRWGSCSPSGTISLNVQLLFLPEMVVRYVLVHELCHVARPDHSAAFWTLVGDHEPGYPRLRRDLRETGWSQVPGWLQDL